MPQHRQLFVACPCRGKRLLKNSQGVSNVNPLNPVNAETMKDLC